MKLHFKTRETRRFRGGSPLWYRDECGRTRCCRPFDWLEADVPGWWWCYATDRWVTTEAPLPEGGSNRYPKQCRNHRQFRRLLKAWSKYMPAGVPLRLSGMLVNGPEIIGRTTGR